MLQLELRQRLEPWLYSFGRGCFVPCTIDLACPYTSNLRVACTESMQPLAAYGPRVERGLSRILRELHPATANLFGPLKSQRRRCGKDSSCQPGQSTYKRLRFGARKDLRIFVALRVRSVRRCDTAMSSRGHLLLMHTREWTCNHLINISRQLLAS